MVCRCVSVFPGAVVCARAHALYVAQVLQSTFWSPENSETSAGSIEAFGIKSNQMWEGSDKQQLQLQLQRTIPSIQSYYLIFCRVMLAGDMLFSIQSISPAPTLCSATLCPHRSSRTSIGSAFNVFQRAIENGDTKR